MLEPSQSKQRRANNSYNSGDDDLFASNPNPDLSPPLSVDEIAPFPPWAADEALPRTAAAPAAVEPDAGVDMPTYMCFFMSFMLF